MALWFTADPHFNHRRIIELCRRPFAGVAEMNAGLVERWNACVEEYDDVWVLGDFAFWYKDAESLDDIFASLNGFKHLVVGNHDEANPRVMKLPWKSQAQIAHVRHGAARFVLCHFPMESWWHMERGMIHLHGHCHASLRRAAPHRFDVGVDVDAWGYGPVKADRIVEMAAGQAFEPTDHHIRPQAGR